MRQDIREDLLMEYEEWLRSVCFQKPTPEAYGLAKEAWLCSFKSKDVERYKWLRERDLNTIREGGIFAGMMPDKYVLNGIDLDQEIDKAMRP